MAVTRETLRLMGEIRVQISDTVSAITDDLVRSWAYAWSQVVDDWEAAVTELDAARVDGAWPPRRVVLRAERAQKALEATYEALLSLNDQAGVRIISGVSSVVEAAQGHVGVIGSQLPARAELRASLVRADAHQIEAIVRRTQQQVTKRVLLLPGDSYNAIRGNLIRGVAQGLNPRVTAKNMVRGIELGFNQSLTRAMTVAWTETLDAHRTAAKVVHQANADVLQGWEWLSALDRRTCPSCWAMHGTIHDLDEPGPEDHQQGRCARLPVVKPWSALGFDVEEPPSLMPNAQTKFDQLSRADQLKVMGPARLQLLDDGQVSLSDLSRRQSNPGWRDSHTVTPVRDLLASS